MPPAMPWTPNSQASNSASAEQDTTVHERRCAARRSAPRDHVDRALGHERPAVAQRHQRARAWAAPASCRRPARARRAAAACSSARMRTLPALTAAPAALGDDGGDRLARRGGRRRPRRRGTAAGVSWTIWPSPRRASSGGSLKPESSNSPISSTPSASARTSPVPAGPRAVRRRSQWPSALRLSPVGCPGAAARRARRRSSSGSDFSTSSWSSTSRTRASCASTAWCSSAERQVLRLERAAGRCGRRASSARPAPVNRDGRVDDADELPRLGRRPRSACTRR